jgi:hypothetical protein
MKAVVAVVTLAWAGCSFDSSGMPGPGAIDANGGGAIDAKISPDAKVVDTDLDGVPDSKDNCPNASNPQQRDHDQDGRGDICDNCPHMINPVQEDGDEDSVGDACDPRPGISGDRIALFEGFYDDGAGLPTGWAANLGTAGVWTRSGGFLHQTANDAVERLITWGASSSFTNAAIDTRVRIDEVPPAGSPTTGVRTAGALVDFQGAPMRYFLCVVRDDVGSTTTTEASIYRESGAAFTQGDHKAYGAELTAGMSYAMTLVIGENDVQDPTNGNGRCRVESPNGPLDLLQTAELPALEAGPAGLRTNGVKASFDYVVIYELAGP